MNEQEQLEERQSEEKVVPVGEAIRYRKRAQAAEQQAEEMERQIEQLRREREELTEQLRTTRDDGELSRRLAAAGIADVEAGVLLARKRLGDDGDLEAAIERLRQDKPHLFAAPLRQTTRIPTKTAGVRERTGASPTIAQAAQNAAASGRRSDVHEYMRVRRTRIRSV